MLTACSTLRGHYAFYVHVDPDRNVTVLVANTYTHRQGRVLLRLCRWKFSHTKFVAEFIRDKLILIHKKTTNSLFGPTFGELGGKVHTSSRPIARWKARSRLFILDRSRWCSAVALRETLGERLPFPPTFVQY